jgi:PadR family transcriptional regulator, regulatory protein PadR
MGKPVDLVQGTLDLLILKAIAAGPLHGWAVAQRINQLSRDVLRVNQGSLYPALQRLEREGWITAEWGASDNNRRARFYSLTKAGRKHLEREQAGWERLSQAIALVLRTA